MVCEICFPAGCTIFIVSCYTDTWSIRHLTLIPEQLVTMDKCGVWTMFPGWLHNFYHLVLYRYVKHSSLHIDSRRVLLRCRDIFYKTPKKAYWIDGLLELMMGCLHWVQIFLYIPHLIYLQFRHASYFWALWSSQIFTGNLSPNITILLSTVFPKGFQSSKLTRGFEIHSVRQHLVKSWVWQT